ALALDLRPGVVDVGKDAGWPAEHAILEGNPFIDADVVLDLAAIADGHARADHHVLADDAVAPDLRPLQHMAEVPDLRAGAYPNTVVDIGGLVYEIWSCPRYPLRRPLPAKLGEPFDCCH